MLGTLRDNFAATALRRPERAALIYGDRTYSYGELNACASQFAHLLVDLNVHKGDAVGLLLHNCPEFAIGFVACQKIGAVSSCLNYRLSAAALAYAVQQEKLKVVLFNAEFSAKIADIIKQAMLNVEVALEAKALKSRLLLQVHDELIFEVIRGEEDVLTVLAREAMGSAYPLKAPLEVSVGIGKSWNEAAH